MVRKIPITKWGIQAHRWLGVFLAINFFLFALTGLILIWKDELSSNSLAPPVTTSISVSQLEVFEKIELYLKTQYPDKKILAIFKDDDQPIYHARITDLHIQHFKGATRLQFSMAGERLSERAPKETGFLNWLLRFHRDLLLGQWGKILVGAIGLFLLLTLASGVFVAPHFYKNQVGKRVRARLGIFHKKIGLSLSSWLLVVIATGTLLAFNSIVIRYFLNSEIQNFARKQPVQNEIPVQHLPVRQLFDGANFQLAADTIDFVSYPDNEFSAPGSYAVLLESDQHHSRVAFFNASSGQLQSLNGLPFYIEWLMASEPLHFGNYGGIALKLLWSVFAILSCALPVTGLLIFAQRKKWIQLENSRGLSGALAGTYWPSWVYSVGFPSACLAAIFGCYFLEGYFQVSAIVAFWIFTFVILLQYLFSLRVLKRGPYAQL